MTTTTTEDRFSGIGGSEVAAIMGLSPFSTPLDVWRSKVLKQDDKPETPAMRAGKRFEATVIAAYAKTLPEGSKVWSLETLRKGYRRANVDAMAEVGGWKRIVEAKATTMGSEWGESGTDTVPLYYDCQGTWYMDMHEVEQADYPVLVWPHSTGMRDLMGLTPAEIVEAIGLRVLSVAYSPTLAKTIRDKVDAFWNDNVLGETPPKPVDLADARRLVWSVKGKTTPITTEIAGRLILRAEVKKAIKELEAQVEAHDFALHEAIGQNEIVVDEEGKPVVTLKTISRAGYTVAPASFRQMHVTKAWKDKNP